MQRFYGRIFFQLGVLNLMLIKMLGSLPLDGCKWSCEMCSTMQYQAPIRVTKEIMNILALVMWDMNWIVFVGAQLYCEVALVGISLKGIVSFSAENSGKLTSH